ncbi:hypothetical protein BBK82_03515 [Lentzea guizhouensis]|uniref:Uncharacterized protein n=1 Tax=Lentzea guizhouensis TaxID=1586287 RepID=A0A1B2HC39_9PSEU|nr:hypothetical protein [Lentzea guizhouensis]ANZ35284.1 hypothetical protein BBK82_03515 [Lentzea guizhouensis]
MTGTWTWMSGVTGAVGAIALLVALLMWTVGGQMWRTVVLGLTITGVAGIMATPIGRWLRSLVEWLVRLSTPVGKYTGVALIILIAVALALVVILNVFGQFSGKNPLATVLSKLGVNSGNGITGRTLICGGALSITAGVVPGTVGMVLTWVLGGVVQLFAWLIMAGFGL